MLRAVAIAESHPRDRRRINRRGRRGRTRSKPRCCVYAHDTPWTRHPTAGRTSASGARSPSASAPIRTPTSSSASTPTPCSITTRSPPGSEPFCDDRTTGVAGFVTAQNWSRNLLTRLIDLRYVSAFLAERAAYSFFGAVLCCCGSLAFYRADVVRANLDDFLDQRFLGPGRDLRRRPAPDELRAAGRPRRAVPELAGIDRRARTTRPLHPPTGPLEQELHPRIAVGARHVPALGQRVLADRRAKCSRGSSSRHCSSSRSRSGRSPTPAGRCSRSSRSSPSPRTPATPCTSTTTAAASDSATGSAIFALAPLYGILHLLVLSPLRFWSLATLRTTRWGTRQQVEVRYTPTPH